MIHFHHPVHSFHPLTNLPPTQGASMTDYLFRGSLREVDPDVYALTQVEA